MEESTPTATTTSTKIIDSTSHKKSQTGASSPAGDKIPKSDIDEHTQPEMDTHDIVQQQPRAMDSDVSFMSYTKDRRDVIIEVHDSSQIDVGQIEDSSMMARPMQQRWYKRAWSSVKGLLGFARNLGQ